MSTHATAAIGDIIAVTAAAISALGIFQVYPFHELVGTAAGLMAITYYVYQFFKWVMSRWD